MQDLILIPVSAGEMFDKITILEIKKTRITDSVKRQNVVRELEELNARSEKISAFLDTKIVNLVQELREINRLLWQIEDDIRNHERDGVFDNKFVALARSVYIENDRRANIKKIINIELGSKIIEEKSYGEY